MMISSALAVKPRRKSLEMNCLMKQLLNGRLVISTHQASLFLAGDISDTLFAVSVLPLASVGTDLRFVAGVVGDIGHVGKAS
mmetsp:Transcript_26801/g.65164  ORF Transcript_26801/g.65164 Transcript_26801/m.65164 type:complete len:82 (+) Transcript_26801:77-322(+)